VDHGGEEDVLRVVVVAGKFVEVGAAKIVGGSGGGAARGEAVSLQTVRLGLGGVVVDADEGVIGIKRGDVGAFVEVDEDVGAAGENGLEPGGAQDGLEPVGGVECVPSVPPWPGSMTTPRMVWRPSISVGRRIGSKSLMMSMRDTSQSWSPPWMGKLRT
jgi:hypothetical protein